MSRMSTCPAAKSNFTLSSVFHTHAQGREFQSLFLNLRVFLLSPTKPWKKLKNKKPGKQFGPLQIIWSQNAIWILAPTNYQLGDQFSHLYNGDKNIHLGALIVGAKSDKVYSVMKTQLQSTGTYLTHLSWWADDSHDGKIQVWTRFTHSWIQTSKTELLPAYSPPCCNPASSWDKTKSQEARGFMSP